HLQRRMACMDKDKTRSARNQLLKRLENFFELPMIILGFVWLALLVIELVYQTSPALETFGLVIWGIFIIDFLFKFFVAPYKSEYLKRNMLTLISLIVPAFRVLRVARILRVFRFSRGLRLVKVLGSLNRSMRALSATMKRRAFGYVIILSVIVLFGGAAGMYAFEKDIQGGLNDYGTALWWTSMILTTMGSEYWPKTFEGRLLCIILALYAFAVFGYVTATIATFFIGRDAEDSNSELAGSEQIESLRREIRELRGIIEKRSE
ncbi:MAG TPA: ion transporter, partial [Chryseosolibacter sp.]|nr:ion transporter [Chryseosolibacter sp.]